MQTEPGFSYHTSTQCQGYYIDSSRTHESLTEGKNTVFDGRRDTYSTYPHTTLMERIATSRTYERLSPLLTGSPHVGYPENYNLPQVC